MITVKALPMMKKAFMLSEQRKSKKLFISEKEETAVTAYVGGDADHAARSLDDFRDPVGRYAQIHR